MAVIRQTEEKDKLPALWRNVCVSEVLIEVLVFSSDLLVLQTAEMHCDPRCISQDSNHDTLDLHRAAMEGHMKVVKFLTLKIKCNPTTRNAYNSTALNLSVVNYIWT